jgi:RNase P/RNase MRP subunit p30
MNIITTTNLNEARKQADKLRKENKPIILLSQDDEFNRKALEIKGLNLLVINENLFLKDYMKQRNSGLNEVLANICAEKNISIGIQIEEIINKDTKEKARALARLAQNIMLCKKSKVKLVFLGNIKDKLALQSLLLSLGADSKQAANSCISADTRPNSKCKCETFSTKQDF